jgi:16S rRNA (cytosine967-C5)-methyltransferase
LSGADSREASRAVFAHYRWLGWLDSSLSTESRVRQALEFDEQFQEDPGLLPVDDLRIRAVPAWTAAEVLFDDAWLRSLQHAPNLWLRARRGQGNALARHLGHAKTLAPPHPPEAVLYEGREDLFQTEEFKAGEFEIQDVTSQMVGSLCDPRPGETWWDACAGEGGKLLHLSDLMANRGLIWASDRADWRLKQLKRRAARARVFNYRVAAWAGGIKLPTKTKFDGVLVDAPCSGVGTWQRNPHARWTTTPDDVRELAALQRELLDNAAPAVKPGGRLFYAVCTLTRAETDMVAEAFSAAHPEFEPRPLVLAAEQTAPTAVPAATVTLWPQHWGGNGMFEAAWTRR